MRYITLQYNTLQLISIHYQGAIVAGFNFIANIWLLKNYKPSQVTVIHLSQPIFGILLGYVVLGEKIGLLASKIRAVRPPEPYKGKGIKYIDETILRKAGKSGK